MHARYEKIHPYIYIVAATTSPSTSTVHMQRERKHEENEEVHDGRKKRRGARGGGIGEYT
jgi:hypothetical protein